VHGTIPSLPPYWPNRSSGELRVTASTCGGVERLEQAAGVSPSTEWSTADVGPVTRPRRRRSSSDATGWRNGAPALAGRSFQDRRHQSGSGRRHSDEMRLL